MKVKNKMKLQMEPSETKGIFKWFFLTTVMGLLIYVGEVNTAVALLAGTGLPFVNK